MKTLYFDIDGTVLLNDRDAVKHELGNGRLEQAIRRAGFARLVCVGNFVTIAHKVREVMPEYDAIGGIFNLCRGAFHDEAWLRSATSLVADAQNRARHIDFSGDWWYVDDLAEYYMAQANEVRRFTEHKGGRICVPDPLGTGLDVLVWLGGTAL